MKSKPIIIVIVGESGSGKTTLSMFLQERLNIPAIVSYTTRPKREGEKDGVDHYFVDASQVPSPEKAFAYTVYGDHYYWTTLDQFAEHSMMSYIIDEKGLIDLMTKWQDKFTVISILIKRPDNPTEQDRRDRDKQRTPIDDSQYDIVLINNRSENELYRMAVLSLGEFIGQIYG